MENNVAFCGLWCGACNSFKKGKCPGCQGNEKASWCEIRKCCLENHYATCADCTLMPLSECKKFNNVFSKVIGFVFRTDRAASIARIKEAGIAVYAAERAQDGRMAIKK